MRLTVIGTGHVGLVTASTLAAVGHQVIGADSDEEKIHQLHTGKPHFYEPGLEEVVGKAMANGALSFTTRTNEAVADADAVFICVGTPPRTSGEANMLAVEQTAREVARHARGTTVIVEKSTVPAGTAERLERVLHLERQHMHAEISVVSNPEFLREGRAVEDALRPERIVVGANSPDPLAVMRKVYEPFVREGARLIETDIKTAELAKHACNAFLALKVSYANALARLCELAGADVVTVVDVMGSDSRIARDYLDAGIGYGGYCFPKDLQAFQQLALRLGFDFSLLDEVARINDQAVEAVLEKIRERLWNLEDKRVGLLGLSFKPGTDDVRYSPALVLASMLLNEGATVVGYDPQAMDAAKDELPGLELAPDPYHAAEGAHGLVVCTDWPEFRTLDMVKLRDTMTYPFLVDGRNIFDPADMRDLGFTYLPTGRPAAV